MTVDTTERIKYCSDNYEVIPYTLSIVAKLDVTNLPHHPPAEIGHVRLVKGKVLFSARKGFKELACKHAAIVPVFLLWRIRHHVVDPAGEIEILLLFVPMLVLEVFSEELKKRYMSLTAPNSREGLHTHLEDLTGGHAHAVIRLYPLAAEVDRSRGPVGISVIDRNEHNVF